MSELKSQPQLIFVSGKGGVGKSSVAAGVAYRKQQEGHRVLLVEFNGHSFFRRYFEVEGEVGFEPVQLTENLDLVCWRGEDCLKEYLSHYVKLSAVVDLFFQNRVMKALVQAAPALKELALLGKVTSGNTQVGPKLPYDVLVIDTYATGHCKALLRAPRGMAEAIKMGPMGAQSRRIHETLLRSDVTQFVLVSLPEELPVTETLELRQFLKNEFQQSPTIVCNRLLQPPISRENLEELRKKLKPLSKEHPKAAGGLQFTEYLLTNGHRQEEFHRKLKTETGSLAATVPFLFARPGREQAQEMARYMEGI